MSRIPIPSSTQDALSAARRGTSAGAKAAAAVTVTRARVETLVHVARNALADAVNEALGSEVDVPHADALAA